MESSLKDYFLFLIMSNYKKNLSLWNNLSTTVLQKHNELTQLIKLAIYYKYEWKKVNWFYYCNRINWFFI